MAAVPPASLSSETLPHDSWVRLGGWLFARRTWLPLPLAIALLLLPPSAATAPLGWIGALFVFGGEAVRLWAVRHIGAISRTRSGRLGPLVDTGPFRFVRNPLYLGNVAIWIGFALGARLPVIAPFVALLL